MNLALSSVQGLNLPAKLGSFAASRAPENPQSLDRYSYAMNNPLRYTDPTGLFATPEEEQFWRALHDLVDQGYTASLLNDAFWTSAHIKQDSYCYACMNALKGIQAAAKARTQFGHPYEEDPSGQDSDGDGIPDTFDCSLFVQWSYQQVGVDIGRTTWTQRSRTAPINEWELRPGDLIFYYPDRNGKGPTHVTMYIGPGMMVEIHDYGYTVGAEAVRSSGFVGNRRPRY